MRTARGPLGWIYEDFDPRSGAPLNGKISSNPFRSNAAVVSSMYQGYRDRHEVESLERGNVGAERAKPSAGNSLHLDTHAPAQVPSVLSSMVGLESNALKESVTYADSPMRAGAGNHPTSVQNPRKTTCLSLDRCEGTGQ